VLPEDVELAEWLPRLGVDPADAADLLAARPGPERLTDLTRARDELVAGIGTVGDELDWRERPGEGNWLHAWALLSAVPAIRRYHEELGVPDEVSWYSLADFGLQLARYRRLYGRPGLAAANWLTLHFRGMLYRLGRLQFQRAVVPDDALGVLGSAKPRLRLRSPQAGGPVLSVHITADGPLTPSACDESFARAVRFFARHHPDDGYRRAYCHSWLMDEQLAGYLSPDANIMRFQRRFVVPETAPVQGADLDVLKFVFDRPSDPLRPGDLDALPQRTSLQRALVTHLRSGGHWWTRVGWCDL
jgi:hypothetical protein